MEDVCRLLESCQDASFERTHFSPGHITASAFIVDPGTETLLLHRHQKLGIWIQLGGHDDGERNPWKSALREAQEESGLLDLSFLGMDILDVDVHRIPVTPKDPAHLHHDIRFLLTARSPESFVMNPSESDDMRWFSFEEALALMKEDGAQRAVFRIKQRLGG